MFLFNPRFYLNYKNKYNLELPPTQDSSDHQDCSIFSRESQPKPSFVTVTVYPTTLLCVGFYIVVTSSQLFYFRREARDRDDISTALEVSDQSRKDFGTYFQ